MIRVKTRRELTRALSLAMRTHTQQRRQARRNAIAHRRLYEALADAAVEFDAADNGQHAAICLRYYRDGISQQRNRDPTYALTGSLNALATVLGVRVPKGMR